MDKTYNDLMDIVNRTKKFDTPKPRAKARPTPIVEDDYIEEETPLEYDVVEEKKPKRKTKSSSTLFGENSAISSMLEKSTKKKSTTAKKTPAKKAPTKKTVKEEKTNDIKDIKEEKVKKTESKSEKSKEKQTTPSTSIDKSDPKNAQLYEALRGTLFSGGTDISEYMKDDEDLSATQENLKDIRAKREAQKINAEITKEQQEYEQLFTGSLGSFYGEEEVQEESTDQPAETVNVAEKNAKLASGLDAIRANLASKKNSAQTTNQSTMSVEKEKRASDTTFELETGNKDLDRKIAEYYKRKQEKIEKYKAQEENFVEEEKEVSNEPVDYESIFGGSMMTRDELLGIKPEEKEPAEASTEETTTVEENSIEEQPIEQIDKTTSETVNEEVEEMSIAQNLEEETNIEEAVEDNAEDNAEDKIEESEEAELTTAQVEEPVVEESTKEAEENTETSSVEEESKKEAQIKSILSDLLYNKKDKSETVSNTTTEEPEKTETIVQTDEQSTDYRKDDYASVWGSESFEQAEDEQAQESQSEEVAKQTEKVEETTESSEIEDKAEETITEEVVGDNFVMTEADPEPKEIVEYADRSVVSVEETDENQSTESTLDQNLEDESNEVVAEESVETTEVNEVVKPAPIAQVEEDEDDGDFVFRKTNITPSTEKVEDVVEENENQVISEESENEIEDVPEDEEILTISTTTTDKKVSDENIEETNSQTEKTDQDIYNLSDSSADLDDYIVSSNSNIEENNNSIPEDLVANAEVEDNEDEETYITIAPRVIEEDEETLEEDEEINNKTINEEYDEVSNTSEGTQVEETTSEEVIDTIETEEKSIEEINDILSTVAEEEKEVITTIDNEPINEETSSDIDAKAESVVDNFVSSIDEIDSRINDSESIVNAFASETIIPSENKEVSNEIESNTLENESVISENTEPSTPQVEEPVSEDVQEETAVEPEDIHDTEEIVDNQQEIIEDSEPVTEVENQDDTHFESVVENERIYEQTAKAENVVPTRPVDDDNTLVMSTLPENKYDLFGNEIVDEEESQEKQPVVEEKEDTISREEFYHEMARLQENLVNQLKGNEVQTESKDFFANDEKDDDEELVEKVASKIIEVLEDQGVEEETTEEEVVEETPTVEETVPEVIEEEKPITSVNPELEAGSKAEPVDPEKFDEYNLLGKDVALNDEDLDYIEKSEEETKPSETDNYFYLSPEDNEKKAVNDEYMTIYEEHNTQTKEVGDINIFKSIGNATPSSEILKEKSIEPKIETNENEIETIYTLMGMEKRTMAKEKNNIKVLYVASECQPFVASGGLADVAGSLPRAIAEQGDIDIRVVMPLYGTIKADYKDKFEYLGNFTVHLSWRQEYCGLFRYFKDGVTYYFIDNERYFKRDKLYGYYDDGERFAYFSKAIVEALPHLNFFPDIIHCNDWQSALVSTYIKTGNWSDFRYYKIRHIYTIHNVEYQGVYGMENLKDLFGIDPRFRNDVDYNGDINLTKAAIQYCDKFTTVSDSYCDNLKQPYCSRGLHHIIIRNEYKLSGIINGIDYDFYNPATDTHIFKNYDVGCIEEKVLNKKLWQDEIGLPVDGDTPMIAIVSRLVGHKGLDLITKIIHNTLQNDIQLVVVGTGDQKYVDYFKQLEIKYPTKVRAFVDTYSNEIARKAYAASDIFVMPSKVEPCGLSQMISSRYGSVPIVREVGGLKDSIRDFGCEGGGNGYTFTNYNPNDLQYQLDRAIKDYSNKSEWKEKMKICMTQDFTWKKPALKYIDLYKSLWNK